MSAEIRAWFEDYKDKLREEGRDEGVVIGERRTLLRQLRLRFGELPASIIARVDAADVTRIERWCDRILAAQTLADVFDDPS